MNMWKILHATILLKNKCFIELTEILTFYYMNIVFKMIILKGHVSNLDEKISNFVVQAGEVARVVRL